MLAPRLSPPLAPLRGLEVAFRQRLIPGHGLHATVAVWGPLISGFPSIGGFAVRRLASPSTCRKTPPCKKPPLFETRSMWEQIRSFPANVGLLCNDVLTYLHIESAARTRNNAWGGRVPRRQRAFQRRLERELGKVLLPVVGYAILPIVGNIFILLAASFPRIMLSHHFLSERQIRMFAAEEYAYERKYNMVLGKYLHSTLQTNYVDMAEAARKAGLEGTADAAGPVLADARVFFEACFGARSGQSAAAWGPRAGGGPTVPDPARLPRPHLLALAHATGAVPPPHFLTTPLFDALPTALVARRVDAVAAELLRDDMMLIGEGHLCAGCADLTEDEVLDACLARGLPTTMSATAEEMRRCLTDHLRMVDRVTAGAAFTEAERSAVKAFVLHLPAMRLWLENWVEGKR